MFEWITSLVEDMGYVGVAFLMFLENLIPPIPSELVMPLAGFVASRGEMNFATLIVTGSIGSLAGAVLWYWIGRTIGERRLRNWVDKHGKWVTLDGEDLDKSRDWFQRHGGASVFVGRLIPGIRTFISVPAGIERMPFGRFLFYSSLGTVMWTAALAGAGHVLEANYDVVEQYMGVISRTVVGGLVLYLGWRYWQQWNRQRA